MAGEGERLGWGAEVLDLQLRKCPFVSLSSHTAFMPTSTKLVFDVSLTPFDSLVLYFKNYRFSMILIIPHLFGILLRLIPRI